MANRTRILPNWLNGMESTSTQDKTEETVPSKKRKTIEGKNNPAEDNKDAFEETGDSASCNREHRKKHEMNSSSTNIEQEASNTREDVSTEAEGITVGIHPHSSSGSNDTDNAKIVYSDTSCEKHNIGNQGLLKDDDGNGSTFTTKVCITSDAAVNSCNNNGDEAGSDPMSSGNSNNCNTSVIHRAPCRYGSNCYRKNSQHLTDFSHPGDDDYNTVDKRPECKYGLSCYRKNPLHRQHYKHTQRMKKPRQVKQSKKVKKDSDDEYEEEDEDDYDIDMFLGDSSDEYQPSDDDEDDDYDGDDTSDKNKDADYV